MCCVNICAGLFRSGWLLFSKNERQCDIDYSAWCTYRPPLRHLASRAPQPARRSDTREWNSQVLDPEMDKQWPYPDTGRQSGSPGDKPHYIKALARLSPLSRINTDKGREKLWSHIQAITQNYVFRMEIPIKAYAASMGTTMTHNIRSNRIWEK